MNRELQLRIGRILTGSRQGADHNVNRSHMLRLAILSSGLSKISAIVQQGIALPLVYTALGAHEYALYLLLTAALGTIAFLQMGAGPGLTSAIAKAHAEGNHREEAAVFASAFLFVASTTTLGAAVVCAVVRLVPAAKLFGTNFSADQPEILHAIDVCMLVMVTTVVLSVVDSALAGYLEQVASNLGNFLGNFVSAGLLIVVCYHRHPSIVEIVVVLFGVASLSRIANLLILLTRRPYLLTGLIHINRQSMGALISVGTGFSLIQGACMIEQSGGTYVMAHLATVQATSVFGLVFKGIVLASSVVAIFTQPLWPTIADALARRDFLWILQAARKTRLVLMTIAGVLTTGLLAATALGVERIWHLKLGEDRAVIVVLAIYLFSNIWTHYHYILLQGLDGVWAVARIIMVENLMMLAFGILLVPKWGAVGMAWGYLLASLAVPAWALPRMLGSRIAMLRRMQESMTQLICNDSSPKNSEVCTNHGQA
jgi:O-antigen/teichoic acid export membrane protein